jgi:hypothetical protein
MPTKKELEDLTWDTRDENILRLLLCYRDRILLENGFEWKTGFKASLEKSDKAQNNITVSRTGITFHVGGKSTYVPFSRNKFDGMAITSALVQIHQGALVPAGWSVESDTEKILFKDIR